MAQDADEDVTALLGEAQVIPHPLMAATYTTLFGLLAVTGMRLGEALRLDRDDVELDVLFSPYGLCLLFIHPRAPNLINLRSASTMPA